MAIVGSDTDWVVLVNDTTWNVTHWVNLTGAQLLAGAYDPLDNMTWYSTWNGVEDIDIVNDSTGTVVQQINDGPYDELWSLTMAFGGTVLFAGWLSCGGAGCYGGVEVLQIPTWHSLGAYTLTDLGLDPTQGPGAMVWVPRSSQLFVTYPSQNAVYVLNYQNLSDPSLNATISIPSPTSIAYDATDNLVYVSGSNTLLAINGDSDSIASTDPSAPSAESIMWEAGTDTLWVPAENGSLYAVDAATGVVGPPVPLAPALSFGSIDPGAGALLLGGVPGQVLVLSTVNRSLVRSFWVGGFAPNDLTFDPENGDVYVDTESSFGYSYGNSAPFEVLSPQGGLVARLPSVEPFDSFYDPPAGGVVLVTSGELHLINSSTNRVVLNVTVPSPVTQPEDGVYDAASDEVYFLANGETLALNATTLAVVRTVAFEGDAIVAVPSENRLYEVNSLSQELEALNASTGQVISNVTTPGTDCDPSSLAFDPTNDLLYIADSNCNDVSVFDTVTGSPWANIPVPGWTWQIEYDPAAGGLIASAPYNDAVYLINDTEDSASETLPVASFPTAVAYDPVTREALVANNGQGTVGVISTPLGISAFVTDPAVATVGRPVTFSVSARLGGAVPPLTYLYSGLPPNCASMNSSQITCSPSSTGTFVVNVTVTDSEGQSAASSYALTVVSPLEFSAFTDEPSEIALGQPVEFWANTTGGWGPLSVSYSGMPSGCELSEGSPVTCVPTRAGSYLIQAVANDSAGIPVTAFTSLAILSVPVYNITFSEAGLPPGTTWSVTLGGSTIDSAGATIDFPEPNGTYNYTIHEVPGYTQESVPNRGELTVSGETIVEPTLEYAQATLTIAFGESGLPAGTLWWLNLTNGETFVSTADILDFDEPNGSYYYVIATSDKEYSPTAPTGSFVVSGANIQRSLAFTLVTYSVGFSESGLPSGTMWWVNFTNGESVSSIDSTLNLVEPNGTYEYSAHAIGYSSRLGNLTVEGANPAPVQVTFVSAPTTSSGGSSEDYVVIVVVLGVGIAGIIVFLRRDRR